MSALIGLVVVIVLILFLDWCYKVYKRNKQLEKVPGPWPIPFFGYKLPTNIFDFKHMFDELIGKYGKTCKLYIGESLHIITCDANLIEQVMKSNVHIKRSKSYDMAKPWLKDGLIVSAGDKWKQRRKLCTPSFHFSVLKDFFTLFKRSSNTLIERLGEQADKGVEIDAREFISKFSFEVIAESSFGTRMNVQNDESLDYINAIDKYTKIVSTRAFSAWKRFDILFKLFSEDFKTHKSSLDVIDGMSKIIIQNKRDECENMNVDVGNVPEIKKNTSLINQLMHNAKLPDEGVQEETNNFLFAGYDTTTTALSFTLFELSKRLDVQEKLYEEIKSTVNNDYSKLTHENVYSMKYLDQVVKEMLRFRSPIPVIERILEEDLKLGDIIYPKGVTITMLLYWLHHHEDYYHDPEKFDPERFNSDNPQPPTFAYVPFSAGPRNCIGQKYALMELKTVLTRIIMEFVIEPVVGAKLELGLAMVLQSKYGFPIKIRKR
ncbi:unnamed protein product [Psylliodes chrysocephalus]|uniref:Cytochrome P450 n=1 Tax=Psylliodes chrysocephalus TaxID=3402493 RepID=A0A9P0CE22_9CUCU|nr:unnamed protein product [Psylliodes chrysocephala]